MATVQDDSVRRRYKPIINPTHAKPVIVSEHLDSPTHIFLQRPLLGALIFDNESSDARDHCANERTFLSWVRLSMYLSIVSVAIIISFHFHSQPTSAERRMALPLGVIFWVLSLACLSNGFANYVITVRKYSSRRALVQYGWKTQLVFTVVAFVILASCMVFLGTNPNKSG